MTPAQLDRIDATLLLLVEAREMAERARGELEHNEAAHLLEALEHVSDQLVLLHGCLMQETYFRTPVAGEHQLALDAA